MAIVYLEDLIKRVPNKYLAVNVIAKRARSLNDELLGAGFAQNQKPISVATDELSSGGLSYQVVDPKVSQDEILPFFATESDGEDHLVELYGEPPAEDSEDDVDKGETEALPDPLRDVFVEKNDADKGETEVVDESETDESEEDSGDSAPEPTASE